jgi:predicted Zn-dependent protease
MSKNPLFSITCVLALLLAVPACETLNQAVDAATQVAVATGQMTPAQANLITKVGKILDDMTPEQEYYLGRTVTATLLDGRKVLNNQTLTTYVNELGQTLAVFSERPNTFKGYHFLVLDSDEVNAFAAPGGFIMITRGMLSLCENEAELAAVLAHEIAHVELEHGIQAINKDKIRQAVGAGAKVAIESQADAELNSLVTALGGSVNDITRTLVQNGYAPKQEYHADESAINILSRAGYSPHALVNVLEKMHAKLGHHPGGFSKTHPPAEDRIKELKADLPEGDAVATAQGTARFKKNTTGVL